MSCQLEREHPLKCATVKGKTHRHNLGTPSGRCGNPGNHPGRSHLHAAVKEADRVHFRVAMMLGMHCPMMHAPQHHTWHAPQQLQ
jgi:hypothetical protein